MYITFILNLVAFYSHLNEIHQIKSFQELYQAQISEFNKCAV
jgi:hypothetical protein